ncbi:gliding motility-associated C-terminal domain-containing protein [Adhaeribacter sp. BT258]|uniref:Gliding motility-associated C-terminal domain-containing protein n=1 Tax=Adhaeribacter terrigena TaxID=2793070 RepID=A0ABS1BZ85_9BACT|nr:gliding motility-associated C-terminal domain-containing protein [Adhaeribacter terrigena]MBK0401585.1 gliding motility-associated C-terminal domain-containing protein [Adhaeribacter terrigena]
MQPRPRHPGFALPTFIQSYFFKPSIYLHQSCLGDTAYHFSINNSGPLDSLRWDFGDPASGKHNTSSQFSPWHSYATGGTYNVQVIAYFQFGSDTLQQSITIPGPPLRNVLGKDTTLCAGSVYTLSPNVPQALSYKWPDNSTDSVFQVRQPGTYWVEIVTECGPYRDSVQVDFLNPPSFSLGSDLTLCAGESITLKPQIKDAAYLWQDGSTKDKLVVDMPGTYWLQASNRCSSTRDSLVVTFREPLPANLLGPDTILCEGVSYTISASGNYTLQWQDGSTSQSFTATQAGTYFADLTNPENCTVRDSITVSYRNCFGKEYLIPNIITPNSDGRNDSFVIWGAKPGTLELSIYNRWGILVYQSDDYRNNWQAENASAGIYYYLLQNKQTRKTYKGWLEVVR